MNKNLVKDVSIFMTDDDNKLFMEYLQKLSEVVLIDTKPTQSNKPKIIESIDEALLSEVVILNANLQALSNYEKNVVEIGGYYHFANTGEGILQLLRSKISSYHKNCLMNGRLAASYCRDDTDKWVKEIFKWIKKTSAKVYRTSITRNLSADVAERNFYALPTAAKTYDGTDGKYLTVGKDIYCVPK
ncbi:hypothetical protein [Flavobacterium cerinum]|uniref:Uncharacterized protein n=1 Tax=Flavobacterium cerinum TaxID=2502784 RepID=A0A444HB93_9FLAO|nr:hypothetical protein [Flavobacterium cerinum]RWX00583.1 hypothetical protein EPI11_09945 [Flavobacterium cerinum]